MNVPSKDNIKVFFRSFLKNILCVLTYYSGIFHFFKILTSRGKDTETLILSFHHISNFRTSYFLYTDKLYSTRSRRYEIGVPMKIFERQVKYINKHFNVISLKDFVRKTKMGEKIPHRSVVFTFDDGYADFFTNAYPVLKKYHVPATVFIIPAIVNLKENIWIDEIAELVLNKTGKKLKITSGLYPEILREEILQTELNTSKKRREMASMIIRELKKLPNTQKNRIIEDLRTGNKQTHVSSQISSSRFLMDWKEITEINNNGIDIGSHSLTHPVLSRLEDKELVSEIYGSKEILEQKLNQKIGAFCYPFGTIGCFNDKTKESIKEAGYECAISSEDGVNDEQTDLFNLKRMGTLMFLGFLGRYSRSVLSLEMHGFFDWFRTY